MCSCDEGAVCVAHRGTRHDPWYLLTHLPDGDDPVNEHVEQERPAEYEVTNG